MKPSMTDLKYISSLLHEIFQIPVFYVNAKAEIELEYTCDWTDSPFYSSRENMLAPFLESAFWMSFPVLHSRDTLENFCSITIQEDGHDQGTLVLGPTAYSKIPDELITGLMNDRWGKANKDEVMNYYRKLPLLSSMNLTKAARLAHFMINNEQLDATMLLQLNRRRSDPSTEAANSAQILSERRLNSNFHHGRDMEEKFFLAIKEGQPELLLNMLQTAPFISGTGVLSKKSEIRNQKNLAIVGVALATRYAMDGGMPSESAYTLSDMYIQAIEELTNTSEINAILIKSLCDFSERVRRNKTNIYSKPIKKCVSHVFKHLYDDLSLSDLAELTDYSPAYLSTLFKKEVGMNFSQYLLKARIEEAKYLINYSDHPLSKIGTMLNFHDQSHFNKAFKKQTEMTPKQFQMQRTANIKF